MSGDAGALIKCGMKTLMTPDYIAFQERSTVQVRTGIGQSSGEGLKTGRHLKVPVRFPFSWLAALHGAP